MAYVSRWGPGGGSDVILLESTSYSCSLGRLHLRLASHMLNDYAKLQKCQRN